MNQKAVVLAAVSILGLVSLPVHAPRGDRAAEAAARAAGTRSWVGPMRAVHARFTGTPGTFAQFGDSITVSMAFWAPLRWKPQPMSPAMTKAWDRVAGFMKPECWDRWKGPEYGSMGSMTIRWAQANVDRWLERHNPEVVLLMFGTNDLVQLEVKEYEQTTRAVVERCLKHGTIVILSTIPPRSGMLEKSRAFAGAVRKIARELEVPLIDYFAEILRRRSHDWDGAMPQFKDLPGDAYQVPTLIARDGVHPSNPRKYAGYSEESLSHNGYALRNSLTLMTYADVIRSVLQRPAGR